MSAIEDLARIRDRAPRIAVLGEVMLDCWWSGRSDRVAREAPAPVVEVSERETAPGGGANTAANLARLGARVELIGLVGDDAGGRVLRHRLADAGVDVSRLRAIPGVRTIRKIRVTAGGQLLLRIDDPRATWPADATLALADAAREAAADCDALVVCDYAAGALTDAVVAALAGAPRSPLVVVDAHDPRRWRTLRPDVVTPNAAEAELVLGRPLGGESERAPRAAHYAEPLLETTGARAAVVTLDREGTVLLRPGRPPHRTHAHAVPDSHASGAGDVFVAALTAARAAGAELDAAADLAQQAAEVAVHGAGTCVCGFEELADRLGRPRPSALGHDELAARIAEHRAAGRRIVFTNGCFDVLHRGHTSYLRQAKRLGDVLVVAINGDDSVRRLKGPERPINPAPDRAEVIAELACVDYVTVFDEDTPIDLIRLLRPDVYAKGGDYTPEMLREAEAVEAIGGEIAILDYVPDQSTSGIVARIRSAPRATAATVAETREAAG